MTIQLFVPPINLTHSAAALPRPCCCGSRSPSPRSRWRSFRSSPARPPGPAWRLIAARRRSHARRSRRRSHLARPAAPPLFRALRSALSGTIPGEAHRRCRYAARLGDHRGSRRTGAAVGPRHARRPPDRTVAEIEVAFKRTLETQAGRRSAPRFHSCSRIPALLVAPDLKTPLTVEDFGLRPAQPARLGAGVGRSESGRAPRLDACAATVVEIVEVAVLNRALARGEAVQASDVALERRAESVPQDAQSDPPHRPPA